ncbi:hypothetical protein PPSIR1_03718 [Plesiocystis pacifica SIR-1]|uniref:VIT domain-containing protein n=1 Tax=Plesiocystis pacifica SIR-1 TaxID=391625 RepID=A6G4A2_9BACT|nr:VIT and VWA domain-containing protein [Plesiocystis pacifica]EDM79214.1 hypothetical protein PPSIR1_03718 [Plesiocystis pacifica SIR-1]
MKTSPLTLSSLLSLALLAGASACVTQAPASAATREAANHPGAGVESGAETARWLYAMESGGVPLGAGSLEVRTAELDASPDTIAVGQDAGADYLALRTLSVDAQVVGSMARYEVEHIFENPGDATLEGTFRFPLPHGAIVTGLAMEIDGQMMDGEILERSKAREIYEEIVDSMRDPALLEWEAGQTFKLRVFPIAPGEKKRVVMRYMAPLVPDAAASSGFAVQVPTARPAMQDAIERVVVRVDGEQRFAEDRRTATDNLRIGLDDAPVPAVVQELDADAGQRYLAARLELDWSQIPAPAADTKTARRTVIVVDSSRSALESWPLAREAVSAVLASLDEGAPFMVLSADLEARSYAGERGAEAIAAAGFARNGVAERTAALTHLELLEPDGASDLGATLDAVEALLAQAPAKDGTLDQVIYIGDGTPTWGQTEAPVLATRARAALGDAPLYALSLGKRDSRDVLEAMSGATGGRTLRPRTLDQVRSFTSFLERAPQLRRLAGVQVAVPGLEGNAAFELDLGVETDADDDESDDNDGTRVELPTLLTPINTTWYEGERPVVHLRLAADAPLPEQVEVQGTLAGGQTITRSLQLGEVRDVPGVRQQWIAEMLRHVSDKPTAVALSVEHQVLSKHTALLVLESEEAYERYAIERRAKKAREAAAKAANGQDPQITGRDLDGDGSAPYLGPGDLQPGDPEVHIPAPRDARSVDILFPDGHVQSARWEEELGQWTVRFLVDDDVEPGIYQVLARVTHGDGRVELLELEYTVDVEAPTMRLELRQRSDGAYDLLAIQELTDADAAREAIEGVDAGAPASTLDARRVEVLMPDGQTLTLRPGTEGRFIRRWEPRADARLSFPMDVTAVVADRALNSRRVELVIDAVSETAGRSER